MDKEDYIKLAEASAKDHEQIVNDGDCDLNCKFKILLKTLIVLFLIITTYFLLK